MFFSLRAIKEGRKDLNYNWEKNMQFGTEYPCCNLSFCIFLNCSENLILPLSFLNL